MSGLMRFFLTDAEDIGIHAKGKLNMIRKVLAATTALFLGTAAIAATPVQEIDVQADLTAISNPKAALYWGHLAYDLKAAITERLADQLADEGAKVTVDIDELSMANTFEEITDVAQARLAGKVHVTSQSDNSKFDSYDLAVDATTLNALDADGKLKKGAFTDAKAYYLAMVNTFADEVAARLD
ncbi:hypothetical protein [Rhodobacter capsulatus]|uniref:hypothetical protein n=2 Tax=Rhodobacter capsulatus TaxID=1061 RepID=UPI0003D2EED1|nr:hypothetical protein [Rhodobacter capsulatus]ETD80032.1 hypothetical protein U716_14280 [Rhodobacter capsulatus B6]